MGQFHPDGRALRLARDATGAKLRGGGQDTKDATRDRGAVAVR